MSWRLWLRYAWPNLAVAASAVAGVLLAGAGIRPFAEIFCVATILGAVAARRAPWSTIDVLERHAQETERELIHRRESRRRRRRIAELETQLAEDVDLHGKNNRGSRRRFGWLSFPRRKR